MKKNYRHKCETCQQTFSSKRDPVRFCSIKCRSAFHNEERRRALAEMRAKA